MTQSVAAEQERKEVEATRFIPDLNVEDIEESPSNPRTHFDEAKLAELALSIGEKGMLEPVLVRHHPDGTGYQLVFGHRRLRAARLAGHLRIPAMVRDMSDEEALELQVEENHKRSDLHPLEEGAGFKALLGFGQNVERIAARLSVSTKFVYDRIKLLELVPQAQKLFLSDEITAGHAIILSRLTPEQQMKAIGGALAEEQSVIGPLWRTEDLLFDPRANEDIDDLPPLTRRPISVRELQSWVDQHCRLKPSAIDPVLFPESAAAIAEAVEKDEKIILLTLSHVLSPDAREAGGARVYTCRSWKNASGEGVESPAGALTGATRPSRTCEKSVLGVFTAGPARGETMRVCVSKVCQVHWPEPQEGKKGKPAATSNESREAQKARWEERERKEAAEQARWVKARPAILAAFKERIEKMPLKPNGPACQVIAKRIVSYRQKPPVSKSLDEFVRALALLIIDSIRDYSAPEDFPLFGKTFGVDVKKILDSAAPASKPEKSAAAKPEKSKAKAKKPAGKGGKKK